MWWSDHWDRKPRPTRDTRWVVAGHQLPRLSSWKLHNLKSKIIINGCRYLFKVFINNIVLTAE